MDDPKEIARIKHARFVHEVGMRAKDKREALLSDLAGRGMANGGSWTGPTLKLGRELGGELVAGLVKIHMETVGPDNLDYQETAKWIQRELKRLWDSLARHYLERNRSMELRWRQAVGQAMPHHSHIEQDLRVAAFDMKPREGASMEEKKAAERRMIVADTIKRAKADANGALNGARNRGFTAGTALIAPVAGTLQQRSLEMVKALARVSHGDADAVELIASELARFHEEMRKEFTPLIAVDAVQWEEGTKGCLPDRERIADEVTIAIMALDQHFQIGTQFNIAGGNSGVLIGGNAQVAGNMTGTPQTKEEMSWGDVWKKVWGWFSGLWGKKT